CWCGGRRAARRIPATSSTLTRACWSAAPRRRRSTSSCRRIATTRRSAPIGASTAPPIPPRSGRPGSRATSTSARPTTSPPGSLRLDLAAFRELEAFAQLGTELDKATQAQLDRGHRMVEILKQPQFKPMNVIDQVMIIFAGARGYLDKVPAKQVAAWEQQFLT